jgi:microcompartment protein CcmK/EutM
MKLAIVTGQIVCTVRHQGLAHDKLLMVEMIDAQEILTGNVLLLSTASGRNRRVGAAGQRKLRPSGAPE